MIGKKRKDCYFGLHFDYHASSTAVNIGENFSSELLAKIIEECKPDFIQCDTKGHPGNASYFTKVGNQAPGLKINLLNEWKNVCHKFNVPVYSHISGAWDARQTEEHPSWAQLNKSGEKTLICSVYSPYPKEVFIPQLIELAKDYEIDGAWIDGDAWALEVDYSPMCLEAYKQKTGKDGREEENKKDFFMFNRNSFINYVDNYIKEVKKVNPDFQITSNWLNTSWVPDPTINITDYISGDLAPTNSVDSARFDCRLIKAFNRSYDIMSWGISYPIHYSKSEEQLEQEASVIISLNGGYQIYNMQSPNNTVDDPSKIKEWGKVAKFVKDRKEYVHDVTFSKDIALLYSTKSFYNSCDDVDRIYLRNCPYSMDYQGVLFSLLDNGRMVETIFEDTLPNLNEYKLLVINNVNELKESTIATILNYAKNGGDVLLVGFDAFNCFKPYLYPSLNFKSRDLAKVITPSYCFEIRDKIAEIENTNRYKGTINAYLGTYYGNRDISNPPPTIYFDEKKEYIAFEKIRFGKGKIGYIPFNFGVAYLEHRTTECLDFMSHVINSMNKDFVLLNENKGQCDALITYKNDKTYLNIVNLLGDHRSNSVATFKKVPELTNVVLKLNSNKKLKRIKPVFASGKISFKQHKNIVTIKIERIHINSIYELEY